MILYGLVAQPSDFRGRRWTTRGADGAYSWALLVGRFVEAISAHSFVPLRAGLLTLLGVDPEQVQLGG